MNFENPQASLASCWGDKDWKSVQCLRSSQPGGGDGPIGAYNFRALRREQQADAEGREICPEEEILSWTSMLNGMKMTNVIGYEVSHYEEKENGETNQSDNDIHRDSIKRVKVKGLRKAPPWYLWYNRLGSNINHFKWVQGASLSDFRCPLIVMAYDSRYSLSVPLYFLK